jgi:hypothetical protein
MPAPRSSISEMEVWSDGEGHHLTNPWPQRSPVRGAAKDGVPTMVKLGRKELWVIRVVSTYEVNKTGEGLVGTAWKLQLADYRRIVLFHTAQRRGSWPASARERSLVSQRRVSSGSAPSQLISAKRSGIGLSLYRPWQQPFVHHAERAGGGKRKCSASNSVFSPDA